MTRRVGEGLSEDMALTLKPREASHTGARRREAEGSLVYWWVARRHVWPQCTEQGEREARRSWPRRVLEGVELELALVFEGQARLQFWGWGTSHSEVSCEGLTHCDVQAQGCGEEGFIGGVVRDKAGRATSGKFWKNLKAEGLEFSEITCSPLSRREA